jgi:hypothetical protein
MRVLIAILSLAVMGTGCRQQANDPVVAPGRGASVDQEALRLRQHDALVETLSELTDAYDAMTDPDATEDEIREAEVRFRFWVLHLRLWRSEDAGRAYFDDVRRLLLREYEAETGRSYQPTTRPAAAPR